MVYTFFDPIRVAEDCYDLTCILRGFLWRCVARRLSEGKEENKSSIWKLVWCSHLPFLQGYFNISV